MRSLMRSGSVAVLAVGALMLSAGGAFAHECTNADRNAHNPGAGAQLIINDNDEIVWLSRGLQARIDQGLVDPDTGEGFHGIVGFDMDGDGVADFSTYIVGPEDEIPDTAQHNGSPCHGVVFIGDYFGCLAG
jgi:hypothetical protein